MNADLRSYVSDVRMKLGNVGERELPLHVMLSRLYSIVNKRLVELNLSSQNWLLRAFEFPLNGTDTYPLSGAEGFGTPVMVEIASGQGGNYIPIEMVNRTNLQLVHGSGKVGVAFDSDGNTPTIRLSTPGYGSLKIWYEPDEPMPRNLEANVPLQRLFRDYVTTEAAMLCLPYVRYFDRDANDARLFKGDLAVSFNLELNGSPPDYNDGWRNAWQIQINRAKNQGVVTRRPFRAGM